ncbi:MAG: hypothetical protein IJ856_04200 [Candidatus Methanomethylophilaceae archaeon]|nr:hypothetical protein [Candidatus Methanomethylophilaceae archaeon]
MYTISKLRMIGLEALEQKLGAVDTERFLVSMMRNAGDYTTSRRQVFDDLSIEEIRRYTSEYCGDHPISEEARKRSDAYKASRQ